MVDVIAGDLVVRPSQRFALVVAEFNRFITGKLAEGAVECLLRHGAKESQVTQVMVPGAIELPLVAKELAKSGKYAAVICLGCVIRGETDLYDHVAGQVARGVGAARGGDGGAGDFWRDYGRYPGASAHSRGAEGGQYRLACGIGRDFDRQRAGQDSGSPVSRFLGRGAVGLEWSQLQDSKKIITDDS